MVVELEYVLPTQQNEGKDWKTKIQGEGRPKVSSLGTFGLFIVNQKVCFYSEAFAQQGVEPPKLNLQLKMLVRHIQTKP
jgi:hypothetical protein